ncbi:MAG TPA: hypothetical protein VFG43_06715 [Geminicoccaceae bacterium]|nr:hypothetical protein [Geminicoccaceae bacterium]
MDRNDEESTLLHEQNLMLALLRSAAEGRGTIESALRILLGLRETAHEPPVVDPDDVLGRLEKAARALAAAGALEPAECGATRITPRGQELLATCAAGIDETVLMRFPEFRAYVRAVLPQAPRSDAREDAFDAGRRAHADGEPLTENPYSPDTVDHLAWENGWCQARDEAADAG